MPPPPNRRPASDACQVRKNATSSPRSSKRGGRPWPYSHGKFSTSQARTSCLNASCSGVGVRSTISASHTDVALP